MATVAELKAEKARRARLPAAIKRLKAGLTPPQVRCINDKSKRKVYHAGRRGGKSTVLASEALAVAGIHPGEIVLVLQKAMTTKAAKMFWQELKTVNERHKLECTFKETEKICELSNGAKISMLGADTEDAADKVRGDRYILVIVDEAGTFRPQILDYLLDQCVEPALMDLEGTLIISGTPNRRKVGPFYAMTLPDSGWSAHNWTMLENTALPILPVGTNTEEERRAWRERQLSELRARRGWTEKHPTYVREYLGLWCEDVGGGAYRINPAINVIDDFPLDKNDKWTFFVGADLGFNDPAALTVWGRKKDDVCLYVIKSGSKPHLIPTAWAAWAETWIDQFKQLGNIGGKVADTGGAGKAYVEQAKSSLNLHFESADKRGKMSHIEFVNGDLESGRIKIFKNACKDLIEDLQELPLNEDGDDVADGYDDHEPDAFLYSHPLASRFQWQGFQRIRERPRRGSREYWDREEQTMLAAMDEEALNKDKPPVDF